MADIIADHGHNVTLFQPFHIAMKNIEGLVKNENIEVGSKNNLKLTNKHFRSSTTIRTNTRKTETFPMFWDSHLMNNPILQAFMMPRYLVSQLQRTAVLLDELKSRNFDVIISESIELTGFHLAHLLDLPCIPTMSAVRFSIFNKLFGQPSAMGYVPHIGSNMAPEAGLFDRLNDIFRNVLMLNWMGRMADLQQTFIENGIGRPVPHWKDLIKQSPIYITNSNPYLDFAVPTTATIVHVGGITMDLKQMKHAGKLPKEYVPILNERESTVLISFGSVIRSFQMPDNFKAGLIKMFESLPDVSFIWKYEKDDAEFEKKLPKNVHLRNWVPQAALLADGRVKVFVTHGGLGSTMEVAYSGKPALTVPIFGDQPDNAMMLARHGGAIAYDKFDLQDGEKLTRTMKDMVENRKYQEKAQELLEILSNQPIDPKLNLMKHLEFAMQFPNLRSQVPAINHVGFVAHYYLDAIAFIAVFGMLSVYGSYRLIRKLPVRFLSKKAKDE
ncbi:Protein CBG08852 [Caenorhabditis briggsae]|uniref:glucuronosyltransferase n=1 Tax=Caenorhabditis briggsae TaxID=6238 RepID=A8X7J5_CAEBR|nr:Protein CBG08852 [Caenorhabditis briggsae]CAP28606.2 Protein CBG08852 [Caenorhabditis briggsae]